MIWWLEILHAVGFVCWVATYIAQRLNIRDLRRELDRANRTIRLLRKDGWKAIEDEAQSRDAGGRFLPRKP